MENGRPKQREEGPGLQNLWGGGGWERERDWGGGGTVTIKLGKVGQGTGGNGGNYVEVMDHKIWYGAERDNIIWEHCEGREEERGGEDCDHRIWKSMPKEKETNWEVEVGGFGFLMTPGLRKDIRCHV